MHLSIVIPTFNREALLTRTIPALLNQQIDEWVTYEIIFVSNGSSDGSEILLSQAVTDYPNKIRYFYIDPTGGPAAPRNKGILEATGEVIIILDDDLLPDTDLVQGFANHHRQFPEQQEACIGEAYVPTELLDDPMSLFHAFPYGPIRNKTTLDYTYFWTCNISFKREFMLNHGMFNDAFLYNEDIVCGHKLNQADMVLRFCQEARGEHLHQGGLEGLTDKGIYIGRWIWATVEFLPEPKIIDRYGVLSSQLPKSRYLKRLINRAGFALLNNPLTRATLRLLGAENQQRSKASDLYYYLQFRSAILTGYSHARKEAKQHGHSKEQLRLLTD